MARLMKPIKERKRKNSCKWANLYEKKLKEEENHHIYVEQEKEEKHLKAIADAEREADHFLDAASKFGFNAGDLIPTLDVEKGMKTDDQYNVEWCLKWLEVVEAELDVRPLIYTARWAYDLFLKRGFEGDLEKLLDYPLWVASYNSGTEPKRQVREWDEWTVWQWAGDGDVPGVKGKCDQNWMAGGKLESLRFPSVCGNCNCGACTCHH